MNRFIAVIAIIFAFSHLRAQGQQQPQLNQFQICSAAYGMSFGKAVELTQQKGFGYFMFREFELKTKSGIKMEMSDHRKVKGERISYTFKPEEFPLLKNANIYFEIIAFKEMPNLEPSAIDIEAFLKMMRSAQGEAKPVEESKVDEVEFAQGSQGDQSG